MIDKVDRAIRIEALTRFTGYYPTDEDEEGETKITHIAQNLFRVPQNISTGKVAIYFVLTESEANKELDKIRYWNISSFQSFKFDLYSAGGSCLIGHVSQVLDKEPVPDTSEMKDKLRDRVNEVVDFMLENNRIDEFDTCRGLVISNYNFMEFEDKDTGLYIYRTRKNYD